MKRSTELLKSTSGMMIVTNEHVFVILDVWMHIVGCFRDNKQALAYREVLIRESPEGCFTVEEHPLI
jgi:hypothetical protein